MSQTKKVPDFPTKLTPANLDQWPLWDNALQIMRKINSSQFIAWLKSVMHINSSYVVYGLERSQAGGVISVAPGVWKINGVQFSQTITKQLTPAALVNNANKRIDLIVAPYDDNQVSLIQGVEALNPVEPAYDPDNFLRVAVVLVQTGGITTPSTVSWGNLTGNIDNQLDLKNRLDAKQPTLQSGINIKTVNGNSLVGAGNISTDAGWDGDGSDGDVVISGTVVLLNNMYYNNLTIASGGNLNSGGFKVFVKGTLAIQAGGQIQRKGLAGVMATSSAQTVAQSAQNGSEVGGGGQGGNGGAGTTGAGNSAPSLPAIGTNFGGSSGNGGAGGAGSGGSGGTGGAAQSGLFRTLRYVTLHMLSGATLPAGGTSGRGSGAGGGDGINAGPAGSAGGNGGGVVGIWAGTVTNNGVIDVAGGAGANGRPGTVGNCGGAGGSGGGGGGFVYIVCNTYSGTGTIELAGGAAGNGGAGAGTGAAGSAGTAGTAGKATIYQKNLNTWTHL